MSPLKLLLVDDDGLIRHTVRRAMTDLGWAVTAVASAVTATEALLEHEFDLILSDVMMPEMTGLELASWVQQRALSTPVVLMSGLADEELRRRATKAGAVELLSKPVRKDALRGLSRFVEPADEQSVSA